MLSTASHRVLSRQLARLSYPFFILLGVLQAILQGYILTLDLEAVTASITIDDTYYYLQPAWNVKQLGFPTFDGIHATNGFQLSWFVVVTGLAHLSPTKTFLLYATLAVCYLLNLLALIPIWASGVALRRTSLAQYAAVLWILVMLGTSTYVTGMENSLHALVFWLVIWRLIRLLQDVRPDGSTSLLSLTALLTLSAWTRLDAGLFSAIFFALAAVASYRACAMPAAARLWRRQVTRAALLAFMGVIIVPAFYQLTAGTFLPISALVKQHWASWQHFFAGGLGLPGVALLLLLALVGLALNRLYLPANQNIRALMKVWAALLAGLLVHLVLTERTRAYSAYHWYLTPAIVFLVLTGAITFDWLGDVLSRRFRARVAHTYRRALCLLLVLLSLPLFVLHATDVKPLYRTRYRVAIWMAENLPQDTVCAAWNAGQLGYFSQRTIINLDGLINGLDYYRRVVAGSLEWPQYVREQNVECIVDYGDRIRGRPGFTLLHSFPIKGPEPQQFHIWRVDN